MSYVGFKKLEGKIAASGKVRNPAAVAASIGAKKYGRKKFQAAAAKGKKMKGVKPLKKKSGAGGIAEDLFSGKEY